jgi:hypothetical protein
MLQGCGSGSAKCFVLKMLTTSFEARCVSASRIASLLVCTDDMSIFNVTLCQGEPMLSLRAT